MIKKSRNPAYAHKGLEKIQTYQPGKPIEEVERELGVFGALKMASNENAWGPSPKAVRAMRAALNKVNRYPDAGCFYLKKALKKKFGMPENRIVIGNGSDELIVMAVRAFLSPGSEIVTAVPTFLIYRIAALVHGARVKEVPMRGFRYDLKTMRRAISSKTRIVFIANPDNPVGTYVRRQELTAFIKSVPGSCLIFIDEAYFEYAANRKDYPDGREYAARPNVVVTRTFSKAYGLCGLRIGYGFGHPRIIEGMNKVREPFNVNLLAQEAALAALQDDGFVKAIVRKTEKEKAYLVRQLERMGIETIPSATNFLLMRAGVRAGAYYQGLMKKGVIVRWMKAWGLDDYLRVTVGRPEENRRFLAELRELLS